MQSSVGSDTVTFPAGTFQQDDILFVVISADGGGDANFGVTLASGTGLGTVELLTANPDESDDHVRCDF